MPEPDPLQPSENVQATIKLGHIHSDAARQNGIDPNACNISLNNVEE